MSDITIQASTQPITVTASAGTVAAGVTSTTVSTAAGGGVGPQGPIGPQGIPGDALSAASDVQFAGLTGGDVLTYSETAGAWTNVDILDGGNF